MSHKPSVNLLLKNCVDPVEEYEVCTDDDRTQLRLHHMLDEEVEGDRADIESILQLTDVSARPMATGRDNSFLGSGNKVRVRRKKVLWGKQVGTESYEACVKQWQPPLQSLGKNGAALHGELPWIKHRIESDFILNPQPRSFQTLIRRLQDQYDLVFNDKMLSERTTYRFKGYEANIAIDRLIKSHRESITDPLQETLLEIFEIEAENPEDLRKLLRFLFQRVRGLGPDSFHSKSKNDTRNESRKKIVKKRDKAGLELSRARSKYKNLTAELQKLDYRALTLDEGF